MAYIEELHPALQVPLRTMGLDALVDMWQDNEPMPPGSGPLVVAGGLFLSALTAAFTETSLLLRRTAGNKEQFQRYSRITENMPDGLYINLLLARSLAIDATTIAIALLAGSVGGPAAALGVKAAENSVLASVNTAIVRRRIRRQGTN